MNAKGLLHEPTRFCTIHIRPAARPTLSHENNNLPDIVSRWSNRNEETTRLRTDQSLLVPKSEIAAKNYDLSINRYKEVIQETVAYDPPYKILADLETLESEIQTGLQELKAMLR